MGDLLNKLRDLLADDAERSAAGECQPGEIWMPLTAADAERLLTLVAVVVETHDGCRTCGGSGRVEHKEYDAASGLMEWAGTRPCPAPHCRAVSRFGLKQ